MILQPKYAEAFSPSATSLCGEDEAVVGLQSSLRSSASLRAILECARQRAQDRDVPHARMRVIEKVCAQYEEHHKAVRDHCLDYYSARPELRSAQSVSQRTNELMRAGRELFGQLREVILQF